MWGTSVAAHQVEGGNTRNDWWLWEQTPGHIQNGDTSAVAADWWHRADDDLVIERDSAVVLVDPSSAPFLAGSEVDFVDDLIGASFRVNNPNATASCGCGTSFSI